MTSIVSNLHLMTDHLTQLSQSVSSQMADPYRGALYYFFPSIGAFFARYHSINGEEPGIDGMLPEMIPSTKKNIIHNEIKDLTRLAEIKRKVIPYTTTTYELFSSSGGAFSFSSPVLYIPYQCLFRPGHSMFTEETQEEQLSTKTHLFSDNETRFLISRSLAEIKENNALLRIAIKVSAILTIFFLYTSPLGWPVGVALFIGQWSVFIISEKFFHSRADSNGVEILSKKLRDRGKAKEVAIQTLEKIRQQNLLKRSKIPISRFYITKEGNNRLDLQHPSLTSRIERLRNFS
jgi:hypothetical protein